MRWLTALLGWLFTCPTCHHSDIHALPCDCPDPRCPCHQEETP